MKCTPALPLWAKRSGTLKPLDSKQLDRLSLKALLGGSSLKKKREREEEEEKIHEYLKK